MYRGKRETWVRRRQWGISHGQQDWLDRWPVAGRPLGVIGAEKVVSGLGCLIVPFRERGLPEGLGFTVDMLPSWLRREKVREGERR